MTYIFHVENKKLVAFQDEKIARDTCYQLVRLGILFWIERVE